MIDRKFARWRGSFSTIAPVVACFRLIRECASPVSSRRQFDPSIDYYAILEIARTATAAEITRSYRRLMRSSHPDRFSDPDEQRRAEERAKDLNAAYAVLSRPALRREYDRATSTRVAAATVRARYSTPRSTSRRRAPTYTQQRASAPRTPSPAAPAQRTSFAQATRQILGTFLAVAIGIMLVVLILAAAVGGLRMLF